ncbi:hypothetical protein HAPAU_09240 [Halalkalicoccus paucihalophilus]|uniref:Uncharacterized protein n=1 Tax=Halalkalicoccus paucihalophilus TaxID=1008153 RepID=A0A151AHD6_9EURY|nr:hypothetical protein [Halalkalicoccus paucihalophilus]KYH27034.1 hypothetical protein HAPAU_09240 [Halalkalicoccus paucihalophilus]
MSEPPSVPSAHPVSDYVEDGARIAAILFVWGAIAAFFTYGMANVGSTGSLLETLGPQIGTVLALAGVLNAVLFVLYRAVDYRQGYE